MQNMLNFQKKSLIIVSASVAALGVWFALSVAETRQIQHLPTPVAPSATPVEAATPSVGETARIDFSATPLADLPADYGENVEKLALEKYHDVYISVHGERLYNKAIVDDFYREALAGKPAFMRMIQYTVEGDPIVTDYYYDGEIFTVTEDSSRDNFSDGISNKNFHVSTYKYLVRADHSRRVEEPQADYYLSNHQNIYAQTTEGETLIGSLGYIPSPPP
ncbi:MAG: DUF4362 domain-containing protein [Propionibacteriaceae bacterium]|jgi:hypothetical protein|nr:DUF4362 domain-containing protein [Propionibacteriaceae bacterium]